MNVLEQADLEGVKLAVSECATPGEKIRSKGQGRGLARGEGRGPIGSPTSPDVPHTLEDLQAKIESIKPSSPATNEKDAPPKAGKGCR